jgi:CRISPR/Cas system CMR-associated protein Cmr3 (group 5 of RAMP superfamily)
MRFPFSRMDILLPNEINGLISNSALVNKYNQEIDRNSAYEILQERLKKEEVPKEFEAEKEIPQKPKGRLENEPDVFSDIM